MRRHKAQSDESLQLLESGEAGNGPDRGTRSTWILLIILFAATIFFVWGVEAEVPWVLRVLEWAAVVF